MYTVFFGKRVLDKNVIIFKETVDTISEGNEVV